MRITVIEVKDLIEDQLIPKKTFFGKLDEEAPHFMYTLLNMQLPPILDRLRLPVVNTASKQRAEELNKPALVRFIEECCQVRRAMT
jgi:hypothetical protein